MPAVEFFPFADYWWFYLLFTGIVLVILAVDLGVFHRDAHAVSFREATIWSVVWVVLALTFNAGLYLYAYSKFHSDPRLLAIPGFEPALAAKTLALEFLTGYVVEQSLSVDNIFVFVLVFSYFGIPARYQHRILFFGIIGAFIFRAIFIALGSVLMQYQAVVYLFGAFLVYTGFKMMFAPAIAVEPEKNKVIKLVRKVLPITPTIEGKRFFIRRDGKLFGTPLLVTLIFVELTDVVFAVDSVPAIFAITREPLIVFTSNMCAILGLRSLYFLLVGVVEMFHLLKYGLAIILMFVGLKMTLLNELYGGHFPISYSLGFIAAVLVLSVGLSLVIRPREVSEPPTQHRP